MLEAYDNAREVVIDPALSYSSYLGGSAFDSGYAISVDSTGAAYLTGETSSTDFPTAGTPFQGSNAGSSDAFFTKVSPSSSLLSGTVTNGGWGKVSVFRASDGVQVGTTIADPTGGWSLLVDDSSWSSSGGYKLYAGPSGPGYQPRWYQTASNYTEAGCVSAPAPGSLDWTLPPASSISGSVHQDPSHAPIPYATVYAFDATLGTLKGVFKADASGNFEASLPSGSYKLLASATGYVNTWCCQSQPNFSSATFLSPPSTGQMIMMASASSISGATRDQETTLAIDEVRVYAYNASTGAFAGYGVSGRSGTLGAYTIPLPGGSYKLYAKSPTTQDEDAWYPTPSASGFGDAYSVSAPASGIDFGLQDAASIQGLALCSGTGVQGAYISAYDSSGTRYPYNVLSQAGGSYSAKVRASSTYKVRFMPNGTCSGNKTFWYQNSGGFSSATSVTPPASGIDRDLA